MQCWRWSPIIYDQMAIREPRLVRRGPISFRGVMERFAVSPHRFVLAASTWMIAPRKSGPTSSQVCPISSPIPLVASSAHGSIPLCAASHSTPCAVDRAGRQPFYRRSLQLKSVQTTANPHKSWFARKIARAFGAAWPSSRKILQNEAGRFWICDIVRANRPPRLPRRWGSVHSKSGRTNTAQSKSSGNYYRIVLESLDSD
jgi:hypothetical protein